MLVIFIIIIIIIIITNQSDSDHLVNSPATHLTVFSPQNSDYIPSLKLT